MAYPKALQQFLDAVACHLGEMSVELEETRGGSWSIDLRGRRHLAVEWQPERGFGLSPRMVPQYGEGPSEIFTAPERAARRVAQILAPKKSDAPAGLAAVRELYGLTQQQVAQRLDKGQPAISQIEKGRDSKLETIDQFIRALGGHMEVRAVFRDSSLPVTLPKPRRGKYPSSRSARTARA